MKVINTENTCPFFIQFAVSCYIHISYDKFLKERDPSGERISHVRRTIEKDTECHRTLCQEEKKKSTIQLSADQFC